MQENISGVCGISCPVLLSWSVHVHSTAMAGLCNKCLLSWDFRIGHCCSHLTDEKHIDPAAIKGRL